MGLAKLSSKRRRGCGSRARASSAWAVIGAQHSAVSRVPPSSATPLQHDEEHRDDRADAASRDPRSRTEQGREGKDHDEHDGGGCHERPVRPAPCGADARQPPRLRSSRGTRRRGRAEESSSPRRGRNRWEPAATKIAAPIIRPITAVPVDRRETTSGEHAGDPARPTSECQLSDPARQKGDEGYGAGNEEERFGICASRRRNTNMAAKPATRTTISYQPHHEEPVGRRWHRCAPAGPR